MRFAEHLALLRDGRVSFDSFARGTAHNWRSLALDLMRRWPAGARCGVEDVTQELLLAAWRFVGKWDPTRGTPLDEYVVWNACDKAKKFLHRERGAKLHGSADRNPSRLPGSLDNLLEGASDQAPRVPSALRMMAIQEDAAELVMAYARALRAARSKREVLALGALEAARGDLDVAAAMLYGNPDARLTCRLSNESAARKLVNRAMVPALQAEIDPEDPPDDLFDDLDCGDEAAA